MRWLTSEIAWLRSRGGAELTLAIALGTFQTCLFIFLLVVLVYLLGDLGEVLDGLSTAAGLGLFLLLWLLTLYCTMRALSEVGLNALSGDPTAIMLVKGAQWGAIDGMCFFLVLSLAVFAFAAVAGEGNGGEPALAATVSLLLLGLIASVIGGVFALIVGGAAGVLVASIEVILLFIARALSGVEGLPPRVAETEAPAD